MRIAVGSDHAGFRLKNEIAHLLRSERYEVHDFGCYTEESVDYPDIAQAACRAVVSGEFDRAILVCGAGVGMSIAANKVPGVRAVLCADEYTARISREHNNTNVLALGERTTGVELAKSVVKAWLSADFDTSGRHGRRVAKLEPECE